MATMLLNGEDVALKIQSQEVIGTLAMAMLPLIAARQGVIAGLGGILAHGLGQGLTAVDPKIQAPLWLLHELGVRAMTVQVGGNGGSVDKVVPEEERARDSSDPFSPGNIATGRAMALSLANLATRQFVLNGEAREVRLLEREKMATAMQAVVDIRRLNEPIHLTTTRALATLIANGVAKDDDRVEAVISLLSDLGVQGITIDKESATITFEGLFSEANAMASAYLQGGGPAGVAAARARIRHLNGQAAAGGAAARPPRSPKGRRRR